MNRSLIRITALALALFGVACAPSVKEACENVGEQCMFDKATIDACIADGEALEEDDKLNDDAIECLAEATSCDEVDACPEAEADDTGDDTSNDATASD